MITWVVGGGGLLGGAIRRHATEPFTSARVQWESLHESATTLQSEARRFRHEAGDRPWAIIWAAGSATVASDPRQASTELATLGTLLEAVRRDAPAGRGAFFLTSSAGGVYAGSSGPPFDAATTPAPISPYGELKLRQEAAAIDLLHDVCPVTIGRFSNVYGPGQNLAKPQGLISRLALAAALRQPVNIFVSLDTIRDYVFADDAAALVHEAIRRSLVTQSTIPTVDVIASGQPVTVGQLIRVVNQVTRRRVPVALGTHASATSQSLDLRLRPTRRPAIDTPLPAGIKRVYLDLLWRLQQKELTA